MKQFRKPSLKSLLSFALLSLLPGSVANAKLINHVIHVSVDGLRPDAVTNLGPTNVPNFYRLRNEGAFTDNARTDYDYTETLPNHTTQLTGRGVLGATGHNWTSNTDPDPGVTLHSNKGSYVAGAFDVAHDNGLRTGCYTGKSKFSLFDTSWDGGNGALDGTSPDNGRDKIDLYFLRADILPLVNTFAADTSAQPQQYSFIHLAWPDTIGHSQGWDPAPGSPYSDSIKDVDNVLGVIFDLVDTNAQFNGRTVIIVTTDHGGTGTAHAAAGTAANYTIPFYIWGPVVAPGASLYALNSANRQDPGTGRPNYSASPQPIRNGEVANLALKLLGLPAVSGSTINAAQDLTWNSSPGPAPAAPTATAAAAVTNCSFTANWNSVSGATGYLLDVSTNSAFTSFVTGYQDRVVGNVLSFNVTGLAATTAHYYRVWAYNANGTSSNASGTISATTTTTVSAPATPMTTAATGVASTSFMANWLVACGATGYRLDVSTNNTFSSYVAGYQNLDVGNLTSRSVSGVSANTTFYYRLRAYNGLGTSGNSATISVTTLDVNFCVPGTLLAHGDMEEPEAYSVCPDWNSYSAGPGAPSWARETTLIHGGSASQRAKNINGVSGSLVGVRQTISANVGDAFTFSGWVRPVSAPAYQQVAMVATWDGSTANPTTGVGTWRISGGAKNVWTQLQNLAGNATATSVTLFLDSRRKASSIDITAYWDDVISYRAYVPPAPTVSSAGSTSVNVGVNVGCNSTNTNAQFAISIGGGAYTLGTHWVQTNGTVGTTAIWQTDAAWATRTVTGLATGTGYTFQEKARYSGSVTQATSFGAGATITAGGAAPPKITLQPSATNLCAGGTATFQVAATGTGTLTYQWQKNQANLSDGGHYSGTATTTLTVSSVDANDAANYRCVVTDANGSTASSEAALALKTATTITQHPANASVVVGGTTNFTVVATGDGTLTYQWQKNQANLNNGGHYSGCTTATLTISNADTNDAASYRCVVTAGCGSSTSFQGALTVSSCATPILLNSSFEGGNVSGVATNWTGYQRSPNPTTVWSIQTASPPSGGGVQYQQIANTSSTGGGGVRQNITGCVIGATYTIAGWMRGNSASAICTVKVSPTASTSWATAINLSPAATYSGASWTNFSGTVTATGTNMTLWLDGQTTGTGLNKAECFDAITVTCTP